MLGKHSTTNLYSQTSFFVVFACLLLLSHSLADLLRLTLDSFYSPGEC